VAVYYVITDHLNTPKKISQPSSNKLAWRVESDPIGLDGGSYSTYVYAGDDPIDGSDPTGQYTVAPGVPAPSAVIQALLNCIESKTGLNLTVTSTSRISSVHPAGTPHARGVAVDVAYPTNPADAAKILCAAGGCGAGFALDEAQHPSAHSTGPHIHIQIPPGTRGGRGDLPATTCGSSPCGK
jgi:hypothetical protein